MIIRGGVEPHGMEVLANARRLHDVELACEEIGAAPGSAAPGSAAGCCGSCWPPDPRGDAP